VIHLPWPGGTALRTLLTGADVRHRRPAGELPFRLVNNYGPTECTVVATSGAVAPETEGQTAPSIGRPITNATALIPDGALSTVPPGEPGELCPAGRARRPRVYRNPVTQAACHRGGGDGADARGCAGGSDQARLR
jgi:non-ribosomal peptide synthetase component F